MSDALRQRIFQELDSLVLIDPHTHINALNPASRTLADVLGYHYYTELAHSSGMPKDLIEEPDLDPKEKCARLIARLGPIQNTIQYSWFIEMARELLGFDGDRITLDNWEAVYDTAAEKMAHVDWAEQVLRASNLEAVFLTNEFDDPLEGFDTGVYIPCLRTDDLVFHLGKLSVRERLERMTDRSIDNAGALREAIGRIFEHFTARDARACAISLPPDFSPQPVSLGRAETAIDSVFSQGMDAAPSHRQALANFVFWTLAEFCAEHRLPFDLMIGVNRGVYADGVYQGQDLYDSRVSLIQYRQLFNAFPQVTFPVSVLASVTNQELVSYAWIFPNVATNGHWWYSNTPTFIEHDLAARLEAVPETKQIGYYSDMYKLEFGLPKFRMYKRILAKVLAERFVIDRGWPEERAIELGKRLLRTNVEEIFECGAGRAVKAFVPAAPLGADELVSADEPLESAESFDTDEPLDSGVLLDADDAVVLDTDEPMPDPRSAPAGHSMDDALVLDTDEPMLLAEEPLDAAEPLAMDELLDENERFDLEK
ncbi:MAG: amidohydrolase [Pirellulaceae bacterium]|nr:amidohydrolase [Pirellulaceae bacterium]